MENQSSTPSIHTLFLDILRQQTETTRLLLDQARKLASMHEEITAFRTMLGKRRLSQGPRGDTPEALIASILQRIESFWLDAREPMPINAITRLYARRMAPLGLTLEAVFAHAEGKLKTFLNPAGGQMIMLQRVWDEAPEDLRIEWLNQTPRDRREKRQRYVETARMMSGGGSTHASTSLTDS